MLGVKERIEYQHVNPLQSVDGLRRQDLRVGDIAEGPDTVAEHARGSVRHLERHHLDVADRHGNVCLQDMRPRLGLRRPRGGANRVVEDVDELVREAVERRA
jgi:hypothetical protein